MTDARRGRSPDERDIDARTLLLRVLVEGLAMRAVRDPGLAKETLGRLLTAAVARVLGECVI
ncbi:MAG: hypothetical protein ACN6RH_18765 [Stenotrophomonas rhizophila]|uniref:hypothetical protein n=1 Tax=Stenotrophomonas rhizophila TaxID=216778 RepID=UPI003D121B04